MPVNTLWGAAGEFAASRHGALSRRQAAELGLTRSAISTMLRRRIVIEPIPGVLVFTSSPVTWRQELMVATLWNRQFGVIGFRSSAALRAVDGYREGSLDLVIPSSRHRQVPRAVHHVGPLDLIDITEIDSIRCTTLERTLCDLGSVDPVPRVREAFEWAWRHGLDLDSLQRTVDRLHRPGQHGTKVIQDLLVEARLHGTPTESALELRLEAILADIEGLVRQFEIFDEMGNFVARVDFAVPSAKLAIEAHSRQFHSGPTAERRDRIRHERITAQSWRVRYVTHEEMKEPLQVRGAIGRLIASGT